MDHVHAQATPRDLGDFLCRGEPRLQDELHDFMVAEHGVGVEQAALNRLASHRLQRYTGAVINHFNHNVGALMQQAQGNQSLLRLARGQTPLTGLQAMVDGVAQHVLQRRHHALQHAAIHFAFGIADHQLDLLAQFAGHLPDHPLQTWHQTLEWHHARTHQAFLKLAVDPPLLLQQALRILRAQGQGFFEIEQVGRRLEQGPRQLLQL
ncbi:hypothetical protein D3C76_1314200 [compost metagenome]